ncbi:MAG TPA: hypothetical protein V6C69_06060 [Trichormus sp.]|jgi:tetratricopeptide (TPR) repeat protein
MDQELQRRRQAMESLRNACEQFEANHSLASIDDGVIELFLTETADIDLEESIKLGVVLALRVLNRLGWDEASKVYKYVIDREPGSPGTYVTWINIGLAMMSDEKHVFEYRKHIAEDVEQLIKKASNGDDQWVAGFWGTFYVKHPLRNDKDANWLEQAAKWRRIEVDSLRRSAELGPHELCQLADVYRQLGNLDYAARLYTEALAYDLSECCENTSAQSIEERLATCRSVNLEK